MEKYNTVPLGFSDLNQDESLLISIFLIIDCVIKRGAIKLILKTFNQEVDDTPLKC